ncbi:MAG: DNA replication/repair protein RecF [Armatimonadetes bacterium]|nr:DNA replication/repair protein RecF [Armatimonadota bacterium]
MDQSLPHFALQSLRLIHFRLFEDESISPSSHLNLITGQNAQGKTTILEAISLISTGRVMRGSRDGEAIQSGSDFARVDGILLGSETKVSVELAEGKRKKALLNDLGLPRASDLMGRLPTVSFSASDLRIVIGDPSDRRFLLDSELSQLFPSYLKHLAIYKRGLEQRNALLKQAHDRHVMDHEFEVWEEQMAESGSHLRDSRIGWVQHVNQAAMKSQDRLGAGEKLSLQYLVKDEVEDLQMGFVESRRIDIRRGSTTIGPHRDDIEIFVDGKPAKQFGSQGQQRTAVISIKLAVSQVATETLGDAPVLLLDDIFSDLDQHRRSRLVSCALEEGGQVFISCTEPEQAGGELIEQAKVFSVQFGKVTER